MFTSATWDPTGHRAPNRLYGSCTVNPNHLQESLRVMDRCFGEWAFVQLGEMLQYAMGFRSPRAGASEGDIERVAFRNAEELYGI
jgi:hypothetical protein